MSAAVRPMTAAERAVRAVEHLDEESGEELEVSFSRSALLPDYHHHHRQDALPPSEDEAAALRQQRDGEGPTGSNSTAAGPTGVTAAPPEDSLPPLSPPSAPDYADRQRLLYHITYLSTQFQRAQLHLQEHRRTITILQAIAASKGAHDSSTAGETGVQQEEFVTLQLPAASQSTTAAVLAARDEAELQAALSQSLPLFDPLLAQETIHRLDSALAQLSLLREVELERLEAAEAELGELRAERIALSARVDSLTTEKTALETENSAMRNGYEAMRVEVGALRGEEARLVRKVVSLEQLMSDGTLMSGVSVVGRQDTNPQHEIPYVSAHFQQQCAALVEEESSARQQLLQSQFWGPMLIAFDAGLTWLSESALLSSQLQQLQETTSTQRCSGGGSTRKATDHVPTGSGGSSNESLLPPPTDADLLLMRSQQDELMVLKSRLGVHAERLRMAQLETDRLRFLYEGEQRRSEVLAADHSRQLQRAYDELMKDRKLLAEQLRAEVEEQVRVAFRDGRRYERQRMRVKAVGTARQSDVQDSVGDIVGRGGKLKRSDDVAGDLMTDPPPVLLKASQGYGGVSARERRRSATETPPQRQQQKRQGHSSGSAGGHGRQPPVIGPTTAASSQRAAGEREKAFQEERPPRMTLKKAARRDRPTDSADGHSTDTSSLSDASSASRR